ncbi:MAG: 4Fe-4S dicluster domain-containing protein [Pseudomonadota bacterium]
MKQSLFSKEGQTVPGPAGLLQDLSRELRACIQCGTCTGSCPNAAAMDMTPRQLWRCLLTNRIEMVFASRTFSLCSSCYCCTLRCPRELPLTEIMARLKQISLCYGLHKEKRSDLFYHCFLDSIRRHGRIRESEFMMMFFWQMKDPRLPIQYSALGWQLMKRGKIHLTLPVRGKRILEPLFQAVERIEGGK